MKLLELPTKEQAITGRKTPVLNAAAKHFITELELQAPYPENMQIVDLGMGCFWGAERLFWQLDGVYLTAVGYAGGFTENPSYEEVCTGYTGHAECVRVIYDPQKISFATLIQAFFENHDVTEGMKQGQDIGTQYRSVIYTHHPQDLAQAQQIAIRFQEELDKLNKGKITTTIQASPNFYFAEEMHQQYLAKNPEGYCGLKGTGISCPITY